MAQYVCFLRTTFQIKQSFVINGKRNRALQILTISVNLNDMYNVETTS